MACAPSADGAAAAATMAAAGGSSSGAALVELREQYNALFEEASYFKRRCTELERESARLEV